MMKCKMEDHAPKSSVRRIPEKMVRRNKHGQVIRENTYKQRSDTFWFTGDWIDKYLEK
jgi:hypothetical protein